MGEYAYNKVTKEKVKLGTCEVMHYCTISQLINETDWFNSVKNERVYWRLPLVKEQKQVQSSFDGHKYWADGDPCEHAGDGNAFDWEESCETRCNTDRVLEVLNKQSEKENCPDWLEKGKGTVQLTHPNGMLVNMPCYHGWKLPENTGDVKVHWNGHTDRMRLSHIKTQGEECWICVSCVDCETMYAISLDDLEYIMSEKKEIYDEKHFYFKGYEECCINPKMVAAIRKEVEFWKAEYNF